MDIHDNVPYEILRTYDSIKCYLMLYPFNVEQQLKNLNSQSSV